MDGAALAERLADVVGSSVPGVAMIVVDRDGVIATAASGSADLRDATPASPSMIAPWFSMTKIVTATTAMRLAERGALDLDEPVAAHVPSVATLLPAERARRITPRHLLSHTAGIANPIPVTWIHPPNVAGPDLDAFLDERLAAHPDLKTEPGETSSYTNVGTLLLGAAMQHATSTPFANIVRTEVLEPVGMTRTSFAYPSDGGAATGYHPKLSPMRFLLPRWVRGPSTRRWMSLHPFLLDGAPYGGLVGPVEDIAPFLRMHLRDGELDGTRLLGEDATRSMREISHPGKRFDLGLGWFRPHGDGAGAEGSEPYVEHLGGGAGFWNVMRVCPRAGIGVAVMGNAT